MALVAQWFPGPSSSDPRTIPADVARAAQTAGWLHASCQASRRQRPLNSGLVLAGDER